MGIQQLVMAGVVTADPPTSVELLIVAGGGGPGGPSGQWSGGGGGGGVIFDPSYSVSAGVNYYTLVGAGGTPGANGGSSRFDSTVMAGGGHGGRYGNPADGLAGSGGSGGGGGVSTGASNNYGSNLDSRYGGPGMYNHPTINYAGGGGGGVSTQTVSTQKNGSNGLQCNIAQVGTWYAGGGGAGAYTDYGGTAGLGGAGRAYGNTSDTGTQSVPNTGGGSGGFSAGGGASGVVIIAYPMEFAELKSIDAGLSYTVSIDGSRPGYIVYTFTGGAGTITF